MTDKKKNILVILFSYVFLWIVFLLLVIFSVTGILPDAEIPVSLRILASWTPTIIARLI